MQYGLVLSMLPQPPTAGSVLYHMAVKSAAALPHAWLHPKLNAWLATSSSAVQLLSLARTKVAERLRHAAPSARPDHWP